MNDMNGEYKYEPKYVTTEFYCPFCEKYSKEFLPTGLDVPVLKEKKVVGGGYRLNAICPNCYSIDRERLIYLYLKNKSQLFDKNLKVLHIAPEKNLQSFLMVQPNIYYISADIDSPLAMTKMDITDIKYEDNSFDVIICNHVLEHIQDDQEAMSELYRVLKPEGWAILQVPISLSLRRTYEDPMVTMPEERERVFGQNDHVRIYAKDYKDRLEKIGFSVEVYSFIKEFGKSTVSNFGLLKDENIYICSKPILIRVEKTTQINSMVKEITTTEEKNLKKKLLVETIDIDRLCHDVECKRDETEVAQFHLLSHLVEGQMVLQIGCGNGDLSIEMAKKGCDVVGVDMSKLGIKQAKEKARNEEVSSRVKFLVMDATRLGFSDNSFDTIFMVDVFEHIRSSKVLLEEAIRVVRNGGRVVVSVLDGLLGPHHDHLRVFFQDTIVEELSEYTEYVEWHEMPFKRWLIYSFFIKKKNLDIIGGPLVDIIMATYNGRKYIRNAINSVVNQTYNNWSLIIINDGGEDVSDIINDFQDNRIKYIKAEHRGKSHALNLGIKNSDGEFITYIDDDDIIYPIHLETLVKVAHQQKADCVYSDWYQVSLDENGREIGRKFEYRQDITPWMLICQNYINHKCILHKRSLLEKTGMYDEELDILIDWDMIRRLFFTCKPYHTWSITSELFLYYNQGIISNRISGLWTRDPDRARRSLERIANKTRELSAKEDELKESIIKSMISLGYYHSLELNQALKERDNRIKDLENQIQLINSSIVIQLVNRYQRIIEKLLRKGTRRHYYYELGLAGIRVIMQEGWRSFFRKVILRIRSCRFS